MQEKFENFYYRRQNVVGLKKKSLTIGTWSVDDPDNFKLESGMQLAGLAAKTVYKIVTVLVTI